MKQIVILISGRGSNMEAIVRACADERWDARIAAVVSNRADAAGLEFARGHGIATEVVDHRAFATRAAFDAALAECIERHSADVVALAGFMRILGPEFVRRFDGRLVNVHPSLLPAFPGLETHRRAIEAGLQGERRDRPFRHRRPRSRTDHRPGVVPVRADDSAAALAARVLVQEHRLYPRAIAWLLEGRLDQRDGIVRHRDGASQLLVSADAPT
jgi:phosphoribosylglycinamide formyltransferase-1